MHTPRFIPGSTNAHIDVHPSLGPTNAHFNVHHQDPQMHTPRFTPGSTNAHINVHLSLGPTNAHINAKPSAGLGLQIYLAILTSFSGKLIWTLKILII